jgi:hypothetical protein
VGVPLTAECSQILDFAAEEADRLGQRSVGTEHRLLALFIVYAKKNAAYVIEGMLQDTKDVVVAVVLRNNAILASMEQVWMHWMSIILVPEGEEWTIALLQVTPGKPT